MIEKVSKLLAEKIGSQSSVLKESLTEKLAPPAFFTSGNAQNLFRIACLHQMVSELPSKSDKHVIFGGYLMHMADMLAGSEPVKAESNSSAEPDSLENKGYNERWHSSVAMLQGLPGPDYLVYLQPAEGVTQGEVTVAELKGGSKMLIIGGDKMDENITDNIIKAMNLTIDDHED